MLFLKVHTLLTLVCADVTYISFFFSPLSEYPMAVAQTARITSQVATADVNHEIYLEENRYIDHSNLIPSFYIPRSGDVNQIRFSRQMFPQESGLAPETDLGFLDLPEPTTSPPVVPGPILSRTRAQSVPRSFEISTTGSTISSPPQAPKNRYISNKVKKSVNPNVLNALNNSSTRKHSLRAGRLGAGPLESEVEDQVPMYTSNSIDVPDPFANLSAYQNPGPPPRLPNYKAPFYKQ